MSETETTLKPAAAKPPRSRPWFLGWLVGVSRLILLAAGIAVGGIAGLAFAQFYPGRIEEPPLVERAIAESTHLFNRVRSVSRTPLSPTPAIPDLAAAVSSEGVLRITLPADRLFAPNSSALLPEAEVLLSSVAGELRPYAGSTVRIAAHTDATDNPDADRTRSFEQAALVQRSLESELGQGYAWVVLGYGAQQPTVENTSDQNRQRNRRIAIEIAP